MILPRIFEGEELFRMKQLTQRSHKTHQAESEKCKYNRSPTTR